MKLKLTAFLVVWECFALTIASAQIPAAKITGMVLDNTNKPVDGATVILLITKDSVVVKTMLANADGSFAFENLKDNTYQLK